MIVLISSEILVRRFANSNVSPEVSFLHFISYSLTVSILRRYVQSGKARRPNPWQRL